jgi:hypothetical protein
MPTDTSITLTLDSRDEVVAVNNPRRRKMNNGLLLSIALSCLLGLYCPTPLRADECPPGFQVQWVESTKIVRVPVRY